MRRPEQLFIFRLTPLVLRLIGIGEDEGQSLLARCGLPASAAVSTCTAPLSSIRQFLAASVAISGRTDLPWALAAAAPEGTYGVAELVVRTAPSLAAGLEALVRYAGSINPIGHFEYRESGGRAEVHYHVPGSADALGEHLNEFTIAYVWLAIRRVAAEALTLKEVWFPHERGADSLRERFGCKVRYGAATSGLAFASVFAARPLRTSDPVVFRYLLAQAEEHAAARGQRSAAALVVDVLESRLGFAGVDLRRAARELGATPRTIQRRLEAEGTSFREVLDQARKRRAEQLVAAGMPLAEVADVLGFSDLRSLRRALARWS